MKAAVWHGVKDIRVEQVKIPEISEGKVKIKVEWAGICGSDLNAYLSGLRPDVHPLTKRKPPLTMGHEFSGTIVELAKGVERLKIGDRVVVEPLLYCKNCSACNKGLYNQCMNIGFIGLNSDGGFTEYVVVDEDKVHILPNKLSFEEGALVEPTAVSFFAVKESKLKAGDTVAIFGAGPIGLLTLILAKVAGASQIIVVDLAEERLLKAKELGATTVLNGMTGNVGENIVQLTNGGVNVAFECAGSQETMNNAISSIRYSGQVMVLASFIEPVKIEMKELMVKSANLTSTLAYRDVFPVVMHMMESKIINVDSIITKKIQLDQIVEEGFHPLIDDKKHIKILVRPE